MISHRRTVDLTELAGIIQMSYAWTVENWRTIPGLPRPFIGGGKNQHPRWRRAQIDAFMDGQDFASGAQPATPAPSTASIETDIEARANSILRRLA